MNSSNVHLLFFQVITLTEDGSNVASRNLPPATLQLPPGMAIHHAPSAVQLQQSKPQQQQQQQQEQQPKPLKTLPTAILTTERYTALTEAHIRCVTFCPTCR